MSPNYILCPGIEHRQDTKDQTDMFRTSKLQNTKFNSIIKAESSGLPVIQALRRLSQEDYCKFEDNLDYIVPDQPSL